MIRFIDVYKEYDNGTKALKGVSMRIDDGEFVFLVGPSGSGKSTIIKLITGEIATTEGRLMVNGYNMNNIRPGQVPYMRRTLGIIFQDFRLMKKKTVYGNLYFAMRAIGTSTRELRRRIPYVLELVGLEKKADQYPGELSGGEQQRVAIARALVNNPSTIVADEPTGNLDTKSTKEVMAILHRLKDEGRTVVVITHQMSVVKEICTHVAILDDGEVVEDGMVSTVFSAPRSQAARHLVFPGGADAAVSDPSQERRIRLIFRSAQTTAIPMVARLAAEESIYANVISASTQKLSEEIYGSMLLGVPRGQLDRAMGFFRSIPNLQAEEVSVDVH